MKSKIQLLLTIVASSIVIGCASVDVTKTAKGYYAPTNPNDVEILLTRPERPYEELGTINAYNFPPNGTAKMHNALRVKAAPIGADAVIFTGQGISPTGAYGTPRQYVMGVAIKWK